MASTNYYATGDTGVIDSYIECIDNGSGSVTLKLFVMRADSNASIDGTYSVSGAASASSSYVLSGSYTEIWSKTFNVSASGGTASLNLSFTIKATSPSAGVKTVNGSLSEVYLDGGTPGGSTGGGGTSGGTYRFNYSACEGISIIVIKTWNESAGTAGEDVISSGASIAWKDYFDVFMKLADGYENPDAEFINFTIDGEAHYKDKYPDYEYTCHGTMTSSNDITITTSATPKQYELTISEGLGSNLTVTRISSNHKDGNSGQLVNGSAIYHDDKLQITCDVDTGYEIPSIKIGNTTLSNGGEYVVSGNTTVTSSTSVKSYTLTLNAEDPGVTIAVSRTSSPLKSAANKTWTKHEEEASYDDIYYGDVLTITFASDPEYKINNQQVNGEYFISGGTYTVADDVYIVAITELSGIVHIFNGTSFDNYIIQIFNGSTWDQYIPYVFDGSKWCICS